ncbi:dicarboxylate/amino acid:cation symporter [Brevundimonas sp. 2R-24]|uniref:Dicarboxylate/amino acid:cation symporter n=1 Tax=Peiella sedimenti TaxID=3061083 RepID=A0ABT8SJL6_9CAUL|nr:dicarboxylate/amino acid:cation symporter [Caulobacteraceae bacterium XZ-24]
MTRLFRSLSVRVLTALILGLVIGAWLKGLNTAPDWLTASVRAVGSLWLSGLQMTVVPLVLALLITGIASMADAAASGRLTRRAVILFLTLLSATVVATFIVIPLALRLWPVDAGAAAALVAGAAGDAPQVNAPDFATWLTSLAPGNPVKAAAETAMLPLVVFGVFFGFAVTRLREDQRRLLVGFFEAIAEAMIVVVRWVLWAAPVGVFALAMTLGLSGGFESSGAIGHYVVLACGAGILVALTAYPLAAAFGGVPLPRFARAIAPAQAVAFSTQSSLGTLPVMVERAVDELGVPERVAGLTLPLAVAVFRMTSPAVNLTVALFIAHVMGIEVGLPQMIAAGLVALAVSISSVGLPGQVSFYISMAPICVAMGVPIDLLPLLLAVEVAPDIFRTVGNVSADLAATTILNRGEQKAALASGADPAI